MCIYNGTIHVNNKLWKPDVSQDSPLVTHTFFVTNTRDENRVNQEGEHKSMEVIDILRIVGPANVMVVPGKVFSATIKLQTYGKHKEGAVLVGGNIDFSRCRDIENLEMEIQVPPEVKTLDMKVTCVTFTHVHLSNARVIANHMITLQHAKITTFVTSNGGVDAKNCEFGHALCKTMSQNLNFTDCVFKSSCKIKTMSGEVMMSGDPGINIDVSTMSGDVTLKGYGGKGGCVNTMSGDVNVWQKGITMGTLYVSTMSGDLYGNRDIQFNTMSGSKHREKGNKY